MKATEQCFPVVFVLYKVTVLFESVDEGATIQMKVTKWYLPEQSYSF